MLDFSFAFTDTCKKHCVLLIYRFASVRYCDNVYSFYRKLSINHRYSTSYLSSKF